MAARTDAPPTLLIFAGGGTGGHIYPALAVAEAARSLAPGVRCTFLCSTRPIDAAILRAHGATFEPIPAAPFGARPRALARFLMSWRGAVARARAVIEREAGTDGRMPVKLVAMGGFVAAPAVSAARRLRIPVALVNLDAVPGKANRVIARRADLNLSATGPAERVPPSWRRIPPIVRRDAMPPAPPDECRRLLGLDPDTPTLFISGGSQGARTINDLLIHLLDTGAEIRDAFRGWQVFHQTGDKGEAEVRAVYERAGIPARVVPFWDRIGVAWGAADAAIARSGAGTVGEVWASATPTIFLPYPYHRDQHQRINAEPLTRVGGAEVIDDLIDPARSAPAFGAAIRRLLTDANRRVAMRDALRSLGPTDGAGQAAKAVLAL